MNIGSGLDTVSSLYGQQKSNYMKAPASAEKTFYTAETPKVYQIFTTDNMLWTGNAPIHYAAISGNRFIGEALLKAKAAIDAQNEEQGTENPCVTGSIPVRGTTNSSI